MIVFVPNSNQSDMKLHFVSILPTLLLSAQVTEKMSIRWKFSKVTFLLIKSCKPSGDSA